VKLNVSISGKAHFNCSVASAIPPMIIIKEAIFHDFGIPFVYGVNVHLNHGAFCVFGVIIYTGIPKIVDNSQGVELFI